MIFVSSPKVAKYLGYFIRKFVDKNFEKWPNLVTLKVNQSKQLPTSKELIIVATFLGLNPMEQLSLSLGIEPWTRS